jgi:hypothetical protein
MVYLCANFWMKMIMNAQPSSILFPAATILKGGSLGLRLTRLEGEVTKERIRSGENEHR